MHVLFGLTSRRLVVFSVAAGVVASGIRNPPPVRSGVAVLALAFATTGAGGLRASSFTVNETEIQVLRLEREVTVTTNEINLLRLKPGARG